MAKLRMNDEYRKKIINRYIDHAESEDTLEDKHTILVRKK